MKEYTVIVEKELAGRIQNIPGRFPLSRNFNEHDRIGYAHVFEENGLVKAVISVNDEVADSIKKLTPAIGGFTRNASGPVTITSVSLNIRPNQDVTIPSIESQTR
jgi:hypothetical protein